MPLPDRIVHGLEPEEPRPVASFGPLDRRRLLVVALLGGLVITIGDHLFHVRTGVVVHHWHPQFDGQSILVYPQFVVAAAAMVLVAQPAVRRLPMPSVPYVCGSIVLFYAAYWLTGQIGVDHPWVTLEILFATFVVRLAFASAESRLPIVLVGVAIGLGGCVGEALNSKSGFFDYTYENVVVPFWLFPLYLHGAAAVVAVGAFARTPAIESPSAVRDGDPQK